MFPMARSGSSTPYHATAAEISTFASATVASGAYGNVGRNLLYNALFNVQQRGTGPWTSGYTADRWALQSVTTGSVSASIGAISAASAASFSDEAAEHNLIATVTAGTGVTEQIALQQNIEDVRRLSGKNVTVSFWAWVGSGTPKIGVELVQYFGSGGSPSAFVSVPMGAVTLSTTPTRYTLTVALPSVSGATFGTTTGSDYTALSLWLSAGSNNATRASSIGLQSGTFEFWGMQLEIGSVATPLEKIDPRLVLSNCQRFYCIGSGSWSFYATAAGQYGLFTVPFAVRMRTAPIVSISPAGGGGYSTVAGYAATPDSFVMQATSSAVANPVYFNYSYTASADL